MSHTSNSNHLQLLPSLTRLPPETLAYIYELCLAQEDEWKLIDICPQGPFGLAQVCKLWRVIVESDPHLWTSIHFYFSGSNQSRNEDVLRVEHVFDLYLKRSGSLSLSLTFIDHRRHHEATEVLISLLSERIRMNSHRWKRISLHLPMARGYLPILFTFTPCDLSSLEYLHIVSGGVISSRFSTPHLNLGSATKLKSLTYTGPGYLADDIIDFHWEQLAEVSFGFEPRFWISSSTSFPQLRYLARCQNITTCSLGISRHFAQTGSNVGQTITLPRLQTLRIRRLHPQSHVRTLINPLILPRLQTLEIDTGKFSDFGNRRLPWLNSNFSDLLTRSGCTLLRLSIRDVDFPNDELVRCLERSPSLTSFLFVPYPRSQDITDVIRILDVTRGNVLRNNQLVPELRDITLGTSVEEYLDLMMAMFWSRGGARARAEGVFPLRRVEVVYVDMPYLRDVGRSRDELPGRVVSFQRELARWVFENENENGLGIEDEERLGASVVVDSPCLI